MHAAFAADAAFHAAFAIIADDMPLLRSLRHYALSMRASFSLSLLITLSFFDADYIITPFDAILLRHCAIAAVTTTMLSFRWLSALPPAHYAAMLIFAIAERVAIDFHRRFSSLTPFSPLLFFCRFFAAISLLPCQPLRH